MTDQNLPSGEEHRPARAAESSARARRVDAQRNLASILDAAQHLLPERPRASMQEIAQRAGVHRATVHRHFASRDDLVAAVRAAAVEDSVTVAERALSDHAKTASEALSAVTDAILQSANRFRLYRFTTWRDDVTEGRSADLRSMLLPVVRSGQTEGSMRADVSAEDLVSAFSGLLTAALPLIAEGSMTVVEGRDFIMRMLAPSTA